MTPTHNVLALDVGDRRIGVALASLEAKMANPLLTIDRQETPEVFVVVQELINQHQVESVVVGLPRGMEGQETAQTASVRQFAKDLEQVISCQVYLQDEATTSLAAEDELKATNKPYQKADIDKLAAAYILNDWLQTSLGA